MFIGGLLRTKRCVQGFPTVCATACPGPLTLDFTTKHFLLLSHGLLPWRAVCFPTSQPLPVIISLPEFPGVLVLHIDLLPPLDTHLKSHFLYGSIPDS